MKPSKFDGFFIAVCLIDGKYFLISGLCFAKSTLFTEGELLSYPNRIQLHIRTIRDQFLYRIDAGAHEFQKVKILPF